jgi:hypothetical protein
MENRGMKGESTVWPVRLGSYWEGVDGDFQIALPTAGLNIRPGMSAAEFAQNCIAWRGAPD